MNICLSVSHLVASQSVYTLYVILATIKALIKENLVEILYVIEVISANMISFTLIEQLSLPHTHTTFFCLLILQLIMVQ